MLAAMGVLLYGTFVVGSFLGLMAGVVREFLTWRKQPVDSRGPFVWFVMETVVSALWAIAWPVLFAKLGKQLYDRTQE